MNVDFIEKIRIEWCKVQYTASVSLDKAVQFLHSVGHNLSASYSFAHDMYVMYNINEITQIFLLQIKW